MLKMSSAWNQSLSIAKRVGVGSAVCSQDTRDIPNQLTVVQQMAARRSSCGLKRLSMLERLDVVTEEAVDDLVVVGLMKSRAPAISAKHGGA